MTWLSNIALEQPAGSHSLAAAAHRGRYTPRAASTGISSEARKGRI